MMCGRDSKEVVKDRTGDDHKTAPSQTSRAYSETPEGLYPGGRVALGDGPQGPHRSGRAGFPHPAPQSYGFATHIGG